MLLEERAQVSIELIIVLAAVVAIVLLLVSQNGNLSAHNYRFYESFQHLPIYLPLEWFKRVVWALEFGYDRVEILKGQAVVCDRERGPEDSF